MTEDWLSFFDGEAPHYLELGFTKNTLAEVDFLIETLDLPEHCSILDLGCGVGRHSVELARRGYKVTGVDFSPGMLAQARQNAQAAGVTIEWIQSDAKLYKAAKPFDAAICLCEGAFGLIDAGEDGDEHDLLILSNIYAALQPGGGFLLNALNGFRDIRQFSQADVESGRFDPLTLVEASTEEWDTPQGKASAVVRQKKYLPQELARLCRTAGFTVLQIWGGTAGKWEKKPVELDEMEMMLVMRKDAPNASNR